jgi:conjugal transfer pilus assembly protein TraU
MIRSVISLFCLYTILLSPSTYASECQGKFVNPITDICWSCIFPISIGPAKINIGGRRDTENPSSLLCQCMAERSGIQKFLPGIPVGFWEPVRLVDITRTPYCMVGLGGIKFTSSNLKHGTVGRKDGQSGAKHSFYQAHWYIYPLIYWLELLTDFMCLEQASMDIGYITELDPMWNNDELAFIINPEAVLFSNPIAQASCGLDCTSATMDFPQNKLFWCGGCQGSLYPFTGNITNHYSGVQASQLITQKIIAKLHRQLTLWETSGEDALCEKKIAPKIKKDQYKLQMTYPIPDATGAYSCNPLGHTTILTESGKEFPYKGEDFGYLIWRKRNCCAF